MELRPRLRKLFVESRAKAQESLHALARSLPSDNSTVYHRLAGFRTELILFMMAAADQEKEKKAISLYFTHLRRTAISLKGEDLQQMGVRPSPIYREVFQAVFDAKLNGRVKTREEELAFAWKRLRG